MKRSIITGTGKYIPQVIRKNSEFGQHRFYSEDREQIITPNPVITEKFRQITGIEERRYAKTGVVASSMAVSAARLAIENSGIDPETLDYIIVAHNYGDIDDGGIQSDTVPALASRVKHQLRIKNASCIAYDILFGCPGWLQGVIQADLFSRAGAGSRSLIIGTETLSRVVDQHDRDSMIFSDGAGASVQEYVETTENGSGLLGTAVQSHTFNELNFIDFGPSYIPEANEFHRFIKMKGRKVYEYAISQVPLAMKICIENSGVKIQDLKKIFIHQANEKMDEVILRNFYKLFDIQVIPENIMPMSIKWLGNSSVATIPTLFDLVRRGELEDHQLTPGDIVLFASVGAGMNINAVCYRY
jgi:3-oxoacyl-[acyl-carrier-protein] synthase-3